MPPVLNLYKPLGLTPLQCIEKFRKEHPEYTDTTLGYAGRLDPMAEGVLLVLVGEENKKRKEYERLPKVYEFDMLFGLTTDTYDLLGIVQETEPKPCTVDAAMLKNQLEIYTGTFDQEYPPYSSALVHGKPLYYWARNNMISSITIPKKSINIISFRLIRLSTISPTLVKSKIWDTIPYLTGEFRQEDILKRWEDFFLHISTQTFQFATLSIECSSGTYIRSLVHELGKHFQCGALAMRIKRTRVGTYTSEEALL
jgi:tRNA pseudouridine55 synthase